MKRFIGILFLILTITGHFKVKAQILHDTSTFNMMRKGIDHIYNLEMESARQIYSEIVKKFPHHPMIYIYRGLITYWENFPLIPSSPSRTSFEKDMKLSMELAKKNAEKKFEAEYLLSNIGARGLLLLFYADNDMSKDVISIASGTYQYVKRSFDYTKTYADFYFITGLYNYYREAYPEAHPVYKAVAVLFPKGDKERGLLELQIASKNSIVLKAEAFSFLSGIYMSFENDFQKAYQFSKTLHHLYPKNTQYLAIYIKNLLLVKHYDEAENLIRKYRKSVNNGSYFQSQLLILDGILNEKKNNPAQAETLYKKGIKGVSQYGTFGNEFTAYGYFGLSRISGDKHLKKSYRKKAIELADFENVNFDN